MLYHDYDIINNMNTILEVKKIHKTFINTFTGINKKREEEFSHILKNTSFVIERGSIIALIGTNGSGKSTLFNIISGLTNINKGEVLYKNRYILNKIPSNKHAKIGIARLFQGNNIFPNLTVLENMMVADNNKLGEQPWEIFTKYKKIKKQEEKRKLKAQNILEKILGENNPLWIKRKHLAGSLSIGQQRLLAFARLLMNEKAELYLLDEPCAGVNSEIQNIISKLIWKLQKQGKTILFVEHNIDFILKTAQNALYLEGGEIVMNDSITKVIQSKRVQQNYFGE